MWFSERVSADAAAPTPDPMAGYRMLGRLLAVGVAAGAVIGGLVGTVLLAGDVSGFWMLGLTAGTLLGIVAAVMAQGLGAALAAVLRRVRPATTPHHVRLLVSAVAVLVATGLAVWLGTRSDVPTVRLVVVVVLAAGLATATAALTSRWCVAPLTPRVAPSADVPPAP